MTTDDITSTPADDVGEDLATQDDDASTWPDEATVRSDGPARPTTWWRVTAVALLAALVALTAVSTVVGFLALRSLTKTHDLTTCEVRAQLDSQSQSQLSQAVRTCVNNS